ncbi:MAG: hypothetical protein LBB75_03750, partial [Oscillospiraceae bacterium]|nr:hypothetical protein [Oscillospiraceae bacterium]
YLGFIHIADCANVTVRGCMFSGHRIYETIGSAGETVSMGTYDFSVRRAVNVTFKNCKQYDSITDTSLWGIMESSFSKNLVYDGCELSRFDAHMGLANGTVRNSVLGHTGVNVTGFGTLLVENTKVCSDRAMISLRGDYGSFWDGEVVIRDCEYVPSGSPLALISGSNNGTHDFGYPCMLPRKVTVDGLVIDDSTHLFFYFGPYIIDYFNQNFGIRNPYPYGRCGEVTVKNVTVKSGWRLLKGPLWSLFALRDIKIKRYSATA